MSKQQRLSSATADHLDILPEVLEGDSRNVDSADKPTSQKGVINFVAAFFTVALMAEPLRRIGTSMGSPLWEQEHLADSSLEEATRIKLRQRLHSAVSKALHEDYREGMRSDFPQELHELVADFGPAVFAELQHSIAAHAVDPNVGFRALTALAKVNLSSIAADRRLFIEWALTSPEPEIRYGAAFALSSLGDSLAIRPLEAAAGREVIPELRLLFRTVANRLRGPRGLGPTL